VIAQFIEQEAPGWESPVTTGIGVGDAAKEKDDITSNE